MARKWPEMEVNVLSYLIFGRPIENRRPMFLSPLVGWLVSLSHEVEKMSNKLFLEEHNKKR